MRTNYDIDASMFSALHNKWVKVITNSYRCFNLRTNEDNLKSKRSTWAKCILRKLSWETSGKSLIVIIFYKEHAIMETIAFTDILRNYMSQQLYVNSGKLIHARITTALSYIQPCYRILQNILLLIISQHRNYTQYQNQMGNHLLYVHTICLDDVRSQTVLICIHYLTPLAADILNVSHL